MHVVAEPGLFVRSLRNVDEEGAEAKGADGDRQQLLTRKGIMRM
tara:strand:- start:439 stop:570 length:132 start_codon:yes stop_codon:yes gene_type:complete